MLTQGQQLAFRLLRKCREEGKYIFFEHTIEEIATQVGIDTSGVIRINNIVKRLLLQGIRNEARTILSAVIEPDSVHGQLLAFAVTNLHLAGLTPNQHKLYIEATTPTPEGKYNPVGAAQYSAARDLLKRLAFCAQEMATLQIGLQFIANNPVGIPGRVFPASYPHIAAALLAEIQAGKPIYKNIRQIATTHGLNYQTVSNVIWFVIPGLRVHMETQSE